MGYLSLKIQKIEETSIKSYIINKKYIHKNLYSGYKNIFYKFKRFLKEEKYDILLFRNKFNK